MTSSLGKAYIIRSIDFSKQKKITKIILRFWTVDKLLSIIVTKGRCFFATGSNSSERRGYEKSAILHVAIADLFGIS